jgi:hypothetical protein
MAIGSSAQRGVTAVPEHCNGFLQMRPAGPRVDRESSYWSACGPSDRHVYNQPEEVA